MSLKSPIYHEFDLAALKGNSKPIRITHIEDTNVDVLELCVRQGGIKIDLTGATITARIVLHAKQDYLINDNVPCTVNNSGNVLIPFDNAVIESHKGVLKIEVNIMRAEDVLTLQFPLWVMVNDTILATAEILPESEGTIPELLKEAAEELARVKDFVTAENVFEILDAALQGNPNTAPTLLIDNTVDQQFNPDGHWIMFYIDSDDNRHNLFDFSNLPSGGTSDYQELENKPQINSHTLSGDQSGSDLGLQNQLTAGENVNIDANGNITITGVTKYRNVSTEQVDDCIENGVLYSLYISGLQSNAQIIAHNNYTTITQHALLDDGRLMYRMRQGETPRQPAGEWSAWESIGGSQIVSGVVNQNGTITFTDSDGNTFTTSGSSVIGADGVGIADVHIDGGGDLIIEYTTGHMENVGHVVGADGQDYVLTAQDKSDIADIVLSELPTTQGVLYGNTSN